MTLSLAVLFLAAAPLWAPDTKPSPSPSPGDVPRREERVDVEAELPVLPPSASTATRLPVPVESLPVSVAVVPRSLFREQDAFVMSDALKNASGANAAPAFGVFDYCVIRGFDSLTGGLVAVDGAPEPESTFYPLDMLWHWNRMYGRRGLTQHQCVLPNEAGAGAARRFLEVLTARGGASFLCVIKDCGPEGVGMLSFPRPGISIALDIAVRKDTPALIDALNECVIKEGGRIYLAKDAFTRAEHFRAMDPRIEEFQRVRRIWDPNRRLRSAQSVRVFGDPA